jgi:hypothetical protein
MILAGCLALCAACAASARAGEIYRWVDENGVVNFSGTLPAGVDAGVDTVIVEDTTPTDYDPEADIYNVAAQAERMQALRDEMDAQREARRERSAAQQPSEPEREVVRYGYPYNYPFGFPQYPRPPARPPRPPVPEPYVTSTLRPPGQPQNR